MKVKVPWGFKEADNFFFPDDYKIKEENNETMNVEDSENPQEDKDLNINTADPFENHLF